MANSYSFSIFYKARVVAAVVRVPDGSPYTDTLTINAFGRTTQTSAPTNGYITTSTLSTSPGASTVGLITSGNIKFENLPTIYNVSGAQINNSAASAALTIPAGYQVDFIGISLGGELRTFVKLTQPHNNYYYEEQGTLTVPLAGYTIRHN